MGTELSGGHEESVLCLASNNGRLLSGGEQGELCLWSLDGEAPVKIKVADGDDINDVTSICCSQQRPHEIYTACGQSVVQFDTRQLNGPVHTYNYNEDEINQISLNEKETHLATCDDAGHVRIISTHDRRLLKTLRKHTNICSTVTFRPRRQWELISGGLDSMLLQWDFSKAKNFCNINMQEIGVQDEGSQDSYLVNPPFIHSLSVSQDGNFLSCGTENALVQIFDSSKRTLEYKITLRHHTQGVSQVHFLPQEGAARELLLSGGNDGKIVIWEIRDGLTDAGAGGATANPPVVNGHGSKHTGSPPASDHTQHFQAEISHGEKINWITSITYQGQQTIAVADNSNKITLYALPQ